MLNNNKDLKENTEEGKEEELKCPLCKGINLIKEGRCITCIDCFWSKCDI